MNAQGCANAVTARLGQDYSAIAPGNPLLNPLSRLIAFHALLLAAVAGLGVANTFLLMPLERVHDLGVFKAVGMTLRQVIARPGFAPSLAGQRAGRGAEP